MRVKDLENNLRRVTESFEQKIRDKESHIEYLDKMHAEMLESHENEQQSLRDIV